MCTADSTAQSVLFLNLQDPSSTKTRNPLVDFVTFAMKLPRFNACTTTTNKEMDSASQQQQQMPTPHASSSRGDDDDRSSHGSAAATGPSIASNMRRCQSVDVSQRPRGFPAMHKSRSHSGEPRPSSQKQHQRTQELPIPPCQNGVHNRPSLSSVDESDLTRMYDYATWNMYERIVSARRQRLSAEMAQQEKQSSSDSSSSQNGANNKVATLAAAAATGSNAMDTKPQPLYKTSSHDESLAATADETDKSSTTSSSWSMTDLSGTFPGGSSSLVAAVFPNFESRSSSCPLPGANNEYHQGGMNNEEDHFIFELDM